MIYSCLYTTKGHLISKCPFGVFKSPQNNKIFVRISALASKKRSHQKSSVRVKIKFSGINCPYLLV